MRIAPMKHGLSSMDWRGFAVEYEPCILLLRHFGKSSVGRPIHRGLGSIDLTAAVRTELHAGEVDDQRMMAQAKCNLGQFGRSLGYAMDAEGTFRWTGESGLSATDLQSPEIDLRRANRDRNCM
jgi:hypothetical protein